MKLRIGNSELGIGILVLALSTPPLGAQTPAAGAKPLAFEVASVKLDNSEGDGTSRAGFQAGGRFVATRVPLQALIAIAYGPDRQMLPNFRILGAPSWIATDRFDIVAKAEAQFADKNGPSPEMTEMLRTLLIERFKLAAHNETRELPIYALVLARTDGKLGPQFRTTELDCSPAARPSGIGSGAPPPPPPPPAAGEFPATCSMMGGLGTLAGGGVKMPQFAAALSRAVERVVVDRTGLDGAFDLNVAYTPDRLPAGFPFAGGPPPPPADGPSIYAALQEQLGLKLDPQRGPVDVLVVDHVEKLVDEDK